jgi:small subunit ribosomal protein S16
MSVLIHSYSPNERVYRVFEDRVAGGVCGFGSILIMCPYMLMIRFQRIGRTNDPAFRIVVLEKERAAKAGNIVELLGTYNPRSKALTLNDQRVKDWIKQGAQPTDSLHNLLVAKGVIDGKKVNVLPKKTPQKSEEAVAAEAAAAAAVPAAVLADVPVEPTEAEVAADAEPAPEEAPATEAAPAAEAASEETPA